MKRKREENVFPKKLHLNSGKLPTTEQVAALNGNLGNVSRVHENWKSFHEIQLVSKHIEVSITVKSDTNFSDWQNSLQFQGVALTSEKFAGKRLWVRSEHRL